MTRLACDLQPLEPRRHLDGATFASLTSRGTLLVTGTATANEISVAFDDILGLAVATCDGDSQSFPASAVQQIRVDAGGGNDRVTVAGPRACTLVGGGGNDTLTAGRRDDSLEGGAGDDIMDGGAGNDFIGGGDGFDTADYFSREVGFEFHIERFNSEDDVPPVNPAEQDGESFARCEPLGETDKIGWFVEGIGGTSLRDSLVAAGGFDDGPSVLEGRGGHDYFFSQYASNTIFHGGAGNDFFQITDKSRETIFGGAGNDVVDGYEDNWLPGAFDAGPGRDTLKVDAAITDVLEVDMRDYPGLEDLSAAGIYNDVTIVIGNDLDNQIVAAGSSREEDRPAQIFGLGGNDTIETGNAGDALFGGDGDDVLIGGLGNDTLRGEDGNDILGGNGGNDVLLGHAGDDNLNGGDGNDRIDGGAGTDTFTGVRGNDVLLTRDTLAESVNGGLGEDAAQADESDELFAVESLIP